MGRLFVGVFIVDVAHAVGGDVPNKSSVLVSKISVPHLLGRIWIWLDDGVEVVIYLGDPREVCFRQNYGNKPRVFAIVQRYNQWSEGICRIFRQDKQQACAVVESQGRTFRPA